MANPTEIQLSDQVAATLSGTADAATGTRFITIGESEYYTSDYRKEAINNRILAVANQLRVVKDGDITFGVWAGGFYDGDTLRSFAGASAQSLTDDAINYIYLTLSGVLGKNITGFPTPSQDGHIPLAIIKTGSESAGQVSGEYDFVDITDCRGRLLFRPADGMSFSDTAAIRGGTESDCDLLHTHESKADKDGDAVEDNFAVFDATGNPVDSGYGVSDFAPASHNHDADYEPIVAVVAKTEDCTIVAADNNKTFTNTGAAGLVNLTLTGSLALGFKARLVVTSAYEFKITAASGETIRCGGSVSKSGGYVSVSQVGDVIEVECVASGNYAVTQLVGIATVETV